MKLSTIMIILLTLVFISCGKDNKVEPAQGQNTNVDGFTAQILAKNGLPKLNESVRFTSLKSYKPMGGRHCFYSVKYKVRVLAITGERIIFQRNNMSQTPARRNSIYCPGLHPELLPVSQVDMTQQEFLLQTNLVINKNLNPMIFCQENKWCQSSKIIMQKDVKKNGIDSVYIESEYEKKNGDTLIRKVYISKENLLDNAFDIEMHNSRTGRMVEFKKKLPERRRRP